MVEKFKSLNGKKKIIIGIIAFLFLPITLLCLGIDLIITGVKTKKLAKFIGGGILALIILIGFASNGKPIKSKQEVVRSNNQINMKSDTKIEKKTKIEEKENLRKNYEKNFLSNDELIKKLNIYEEIYAVIPGAIQEVSESNDKIQMQKVFSSSKEILAKCNLELENLLAELDSNSEQYKIINMLYTSMVYMNDACNNGIKYLDKNEFKYYEKFEKGCVDAGTYLNAYVQYKENVR